MSDQLILLQHSFGTGPESQFGSTMYGDLPLKCRILVMATKTSRLDLRLTEEQHSTIEQAAEQAGSTLSGWAITTLTGEAVRQLADARVTEIAADSWSDFLQLLNQPQDPRTTELLQRKPVWE
jgi:uncharacterized protein (DUF1778 family)